MALLVVVIPVIHTIAAIIAIMDTAVATTIINVRLMYA